jgi:hypothetical protein
MSKASNLNFTKGCTYINIYNTINYLHKSIGFYVLTDVTVKCTILWVAMTRTSVKAHRRFGVPPCLHFHGRKVIQTRNHQYNCKKLPINLLRSTSLFGLFFAYEDGGDMCLRNFGGFLFRTTSNTTQKNLLVLKQNRFE